MKAQYDGTCNPVQVNTSNAPAEQRKAYSRMSRHAGKGDAPRSIFSDEFRRNYDRVFRRSRHQQVTTVTKTPHR